MCKIIINKLITAIITTVAFDTVRKFLKLTNLTHSADGDEIRYNSSFNSGAGISVRRGRRRYRRDVDDNDSLNDLDLDESFDPEVTMMTLLLTSGLCDGLIGSRF